jgi:hypothetical protein
MCNSFESLWSVTAGLFGSLRSLSATRAGLLLIACLWVSGSTALTPANTPPALTVHEWGTFTSVAGADGMPLEWLPLAAPSDLPWFVERNRINVKVSVPGTVRMETPVLYFYASRDTTVDVSVRFRTGVITEWFPHATVELSHSCHENALTGVCSEGTIRWRSVKVSPGAVENFPFDNRPSHYFTARRTSANPLQSGVDAEKFLFYRGVGRFALPLAATIDSFGNVTLRQYGRHGVDDVVLFANYGGRITYSVRRVIDGQVSLDPLVTEQTPAREIERMLLASGMYPDEAAAMIESWQDSWFDEGTRLFYIVPRATIDAILPLEIVPRPSEVARAFVGRMELFTRVEEEAITDALRASDFGALKKYGRFLEAFGRRVLSDTTPSDRPAVEQRLRAAYSAIATTSTSTTLP